jgi:hypothetical protein
VPDRIDWQASAAIADSIAAKQKACWANAVRALLFSVLESPGEPMVYVEGYIVLMGAVIIEHGWLVQGNALLDPTLVLGEEAEHMHDLADYFPGVQYTHREVEDLVVRQKIAPPFVWHHGFGGSNHPAYMQARDQAWKTTWGATPNDLVQTWRSHAR